MIQADHIHKRYDGKPVLNGVGFTLAKGRTLCVLGSSGCGKTTLLQILAGLVPADEGSLLVDGQDVFSMPPEKRGMVYLSQEPLLFPHLNVMENIAFGLRIRKVDKAQIHSRVDELIGMLGLENLGNRMPAALSGGQRQRVAFGRALIIQPKVMLLDEPFGSLDVQTRAEMQSLYRQLSLELSTTTVFVTHDLKEALLMGDELARMDTGRLTVFADRKAFIQSPETGVLKEMDFWNRMGSE